MRQSIYILLSCLLLCNCQVESEEKTPMQSLTLKGKANMPKIVLISGDEEYRSEEALSQLAKILNMHHGFNCSVLFAQDPAQAGIINPNYLNNIPGLEQLSDADLMLIFTRFRALPDSQMIHIDNYLKSGKPVLGIRTATHAFHFADTTLESNYRHYDNYYKGDDVWKGGFGRLVLGEKWISHHGHHKHQSTRGLAADGQTEHPILSGITDGDIWGPSDVYGVRLPLPDDAQPIVMGQVIDRVGKYDENDALYGMKPTDTTIAEANPGANKKYNPNDPMMPIAWTKSYQLPDGKKGKAFASTIGASTDLLSEGTRRLLVNAVFWCLDKDVPTQAKVDIVGKYTPSAYAFTEKDHWIKENRSIKSLR